jgi:hypothetical protein
MAFASFEAFGFSIEFLRLPAAFSLSANFFLLAWLFLSTEFFRLMPLFLHSARFSPEVLPVFALLSHVVLKPLSV